MHFKHFRWQVAKLASIRDQIDPKPQYQRGDTWDDRARSLLIDSILNTYDIPKIYLRYSKGIGAFTYEVADGQQRLKSLWKFLDNELVLSGMSDKYLHLNGKMCRNLTDAEKEKIESYFVVTTVVYDATNDETRELFRRLQLGVRLNAAELRNSMASALGNQVRAMALTHPFFANSPFGFARYKADDLVAHAFAIILYERKRDIKAPDLKEMYIEYKDALPSAVSGAVNEILRFMNAMQTGISRCISTKWGFVDLIGVLSQRTLKDVDPIEMAEAYVDWETERAAYASRISELASAPVKSKQRRLFEYISAFQKEGATKRNLEKRFLVLNSILP